ncbi:TetR/AcrR family transcriptional regulator [Paraburkholderia jirisanensis]
MRKTKAGKEETRKRILAVASQQFRSKGIDGTSIAGIMTSADLTHGGFYRHFSSKEDLVAKACAAHMDSFVDAAKAAAESSPAPFLMHLENYLSTEYRDSVLGGCPLVSIGSDLARADEETRRGVTKRLERLVNLIARWAEAEGTASATESAIFTLSSMVGAITLARIVEPRKLSDQILDVTKKRLAKLQTLA